MAEQKQQKQTFEQALAELGKIVTEVEEGKVPLEKSIDRYEQGMKLIQYCRGILENAEKRIEVINKKAQPQSEQGGGDAVPF